MFYSHAKITNSHVPFADNIGERVYMVEFDGKLPAHLQRWQRTVDAMLTDITLGGPQYIMVDQGFVKAGQTLRKPGVHIDGFWEPKMYAHGGGHGGHTGGGQPRHQGGKHLQWNNRTELLVLASDEPGCVVYEGEWEGEVDEAHGVSNLSGQLGKQLMQPHHAYAGDTATLLHESIPQGWDAWRSVVRLNCYNATHH